MGDPVTPQQWPGLPMVLDELDQVPRREAFTATHPGTEFGRAGRMYLGHVPYTENGEERSITVRADSWRAVLNSLDEYFSDDGPDSG